MDKKYLKNIEYLKIIIKLKDEILNEISRQTVFKEDPDKIIGEDKINLIAARHIRFRDDRIMFLEKENEDLL